MEKWRGISPEPGIFWELSPEETTVLAYLSWCMATHNPAYMPDLFDLPNRDDIPMGRKGAEQAINGLMELKIASVWGTHNGRERPMSVFLGGMRPMASQRSFRPHQVRPNPPSSQKSPDPPGKPPARKKSPGRYVEVGLRASNDTPKDIFQTLVRIREELLAAEQIPDKLRQIETKLRLAEEKAEVYEKWAEAEPRPEVLRAAKKKRDALPHIRDQVQRVREKRSQGKA